MITDRFLINSESEVVCPNGTFTIPADLLKVEPITRTEHGMSSPNFHHPVILSYAISGIT